MLFEIVELPKSGVDVSLDGKIAPTNTLPNEPETATAKNSLVPLV